MKRGGDSEPVSAVPPGIVAPRDYSRIFLGQSELALRMRRFDWARTSIGAPEAWPQSLKTAVGIMLTSQQPIWIGWGDELIYLYNDPYKSIIGGKHPWALGRPTAVVWREIWCDIGPMLDKAIGGHEGTYVESQLLIMERNGYPEETYYTFSYSPIFTEDGVARGIFCANTEDTKRVIGERQLALLRELAASATDARTWQQACARAASALATNTRDLPFALIYMLEPGGRTASLAGLSGIDAGHPAAPATIDLDASDLDAADLDDSDLDASGIWPLADALGQSAPCVVKHIAEKAGADFPSGPWDRSPGDAVVISIPSSGQSGRSGFLIVGLNPFRILDGDYAGFLGLVVGQIAAAIASAEAYEHERHRAEALAEIDRAKTAFFSNTSHELRTPLTLMLSPLQELLARDHGAPRIAAERGELELIHRNGIRLQKLVNTLLNFSRIEAGRVQAVYEPIDLAAYTADLASTFRSAMDKAGLRFVVDCPALPEQLYVDRDMWEKIVLNLISNAFKYTLEGEVVVALRADADDRNVALTVRDSGVGIPADELPRLFERFHRIPGQNGRTQEGTGIGLALVQELVRLHGGTVRAQSAAGRGTTLTVSIPTGTAHLPPASIRSGRSLSEAGVNADAFAEEALRWLPGADSSAATDLNNSILGMAPETANAPHRAVVLLADDNADMRNYVRRLLSERYLVEAVSDGQAALEAANRRRPDLVLTDVMMPRLDGFGLLRAFRADANLRDVPVILLSARAGEEASVEGLESGADDYLTKPFNARELLARVRANLDLASLRRETVRIETELRQQAEVAQERAESILASINDGFLTLDQNWNFNFVNAAAERMLGRNPEELVGKCIWDLYPEAVGSPLEINYRRAMAERVSVAFEYHSQSLPRWFDIRAYPARDGGLSVYFQDITERKQADNALLRLNETLETQVAERTEEVQAKEARLRTIFQTSYTYQGLMALDGTLLDANATSLEGIGAKLEDVVGKPFWETPWFTRTPQMPELVRDAIPVVAKGEVLRKEICVNLPVGGWRWFDFQMRPVRDGQGAVVAIVPEAVEVTARRQAEEAFRQSQKMEAIGQLTGGVAHDFNNLLTIIRSSSDLLRRRELPEDRRKKYIDAISDTADRAAKLTSQLLTFSRRGAINPRVFDVADRLKRVTEMLGTILGPRIALELEVSERPLPVEADINQFETALVNLAANARDAMDGAGTLKIRLTSARGASTNASAAATDDFVAVAVSDTGCGIAPDHIEKIFEPFFTTKQVGQGTGLGLSQVYGFVKQSGGSVAVQSEIGQGTTITLRLPRSGKPIQPSDDTVTAARNAPTPRGTVLVVEDNTEVGEFASQLLRDLGYQTTLARNAEEALQLLDEDADRFDIVFSDVVMPGMDGVSLGREIRRRLSHLPFVLTSGYSNVLAEEGNRDFELLQKPYSVEDLSRTLRQAMKNRQPL
jgi:PAS domain S-box-containing protein